MARPQQRIEEDLKAALKAGDKLRLSTLRLLLAEIKNERIRRGEEVDEAAFLSLVQKGIKQRKDAAEQYRKGGRPELAEKEETEADQLGAYLPEAVSEDELERAVRDLIAAKGLSGPAGLGPIMRELMPRFAGRTDGATLQKIARRLLASAQ